MSSTDSPNSLGDEAASPDRLGAGVDLVRPAASHAALQLPRLLPARPPARRLTCLPERRSSNTLHACYEAALKVRPELRRVHHEWAAGHEPDDETWLRVLWPAVFPTVKLTVDGYVESFGNHQADAVEAVSELQQQAPRRLHQIQIIRTRKGKQAWVPWSVEAAALVLDIMAVDVQTLGDAALQYHRVKEWPERRRRERSLPRFDLEEYRRDGIFHLLAQTDLRPVEPPSWLWFLRVVVAAMLDCPPHLRRLWVHRERRDELDDTVWGVQYRRDLRSQIRKTLLLRLWMDGHSRHPFADKQATIGESELAAEWQTLTSKFLDEDGDFLVEPALALSETLHIAATTARSTSPDRGTVRLLDSVAGWVLVRLLGGYGRCWVDQRERLRLEPWLLALLRQHLTRPTTGVEDWLTLLDNNGQAGSSKGRRQFGETWRDCDLLREAYRRLAADNEFRKACAAWRPGKKKVSPLRTLLGQMVKLGNQDENDGAAPSELIGGVSADQVATDGAREGSLDTDDEMTLRELAGALSPEEQRVLHDCLAEEKEFADYPKELQVRLKGLAHGKGVT